MFSYQLKAAFRYFLKKKVFISINLIGLVIAFAVSSLIMLYVINELKFNSEHKNRKHIYRVTSTQNAIQTSSASTTLDLGPKIQESFPEVIGMCRFIKNRSWIVKDQNDIPAKSVFVDPDFVRMFSLQILQGDISDLFAEPNAVVITISMAKTLFGSEYPIEKELKVKFPQGEHFFKIKAVVVDFSEFSSVSGDLFFRFNFYQDNLCDAFLESYPFFTTFLLTSKRAEIKNLEDKINHANVEKWTGISTFKYQLQEFSQMYLHSGYLGNNPFPTGNSRILYGLIFLVSLVVIMACLNFGILTTACTITRNKELGVRKINGASAKQIKRQMMFESYLQAMIALTIALFVTHLLLPLFNNYLNCNLKFDLISNTPFLIGVIGMVILTATVSGLFASLSSSRVNPVQLLRKDQPKFELGLNLNKILLTGQMIVVIWFLTATFVIFNQISFSKSSNLGYNPENLLVVHVKNPNWKGNLMNPQYENAGRMEDLKRSLSGHPSIKGVSVIHELPPLRDQLGNGIIKNQKTNETFPIAEIGCLANLPELLGYRLKSGSFFSENYDGEQKNEILLNEVAVKYLGMESPVGEIISMDGAKDVKIIGVVYDFNFQSMRREIVPIRIRKTERFLSRFDIVIRYNPQMSGEAISHFNQVFNDLYKGYEKEVAFHEDMIEELYKKELFEAKVLVLGIVLAIFIAVMGILGITLFAVRQQVKEIGIRKINGAKVSDILSMLNLNLMKWVAVAFVIATPLAWYAMHFWLENFAYKTTLSWWIFALAGLLALGIALLTVSWQSWKAATKNPVEALRYE
jgi:putative ABC transport system permease protein